MIVLLRFECDSRGWFFFKESMYEKILDMTVGIECVFSCLFMILITRYLSFYVYGPTLEVCEYSFYCAVDRMISNLK